MKHFRYIFISIVLLGAASCTQKAKKAEIIGPPDIPSDWRLLDEGDCIIRYPPDWEVRKDVSGALFCLLSGQTSPEDSIRDNVNLVVEPLAKAISIDRYVALAIHKISDKYKVLEEKKYLIDGQEYFHLGLTGKDRLHLSLNIFMKDRKVFVLTFTYESKGSAKIKSEGDKIIKSFKLK
jgi:hypothetical protein